MTEDVQVTGCLAGKGSGSSKRLEDLGRVGQTSGYPRRLGAQVGQQYTQRIDGWRRLHGEPAQPRFKQSGLQLLKWTS